MARKLVEGMGFISRPKHVGASGFFDGRRNGIDLIVDGEVYVLTLTQARRLRAELGVVEEVEREAKRKEKR